MAKRKAFALRIDPQILEALEAWAADEFRSVNGQIEWVLHNALKKAGRIKKNRRGNAGGGSSTPERTE